MGVKRIFNSQEAQLSRLLKNENGLFISKAIQKAFIEINEEGAEAAATNRQFFFLFRHKKYSLHASFYKSFFFEGYHKQTYSG